MDKQKNNMYRKRQYMLFKESLCFLYISSVFVRGINRTNFTALPAFYTTFRIDNIFIRAFGNTFHRTLRGAGAAGNTIVTYRISHNITSSAVYKYMITRYAV